MTRWHALYICTDPSHRRERSNGFGYTRIIRTSGDPLPCPKCGTSNYPVDQVKY